MASNVYLFPVNYTDNMNKEMKDLREQLDHSSRQKDSLIVQLQQTLMLITQQQYSKMLNIRPKDEDGETVVVAVNDAENSGTALVTVLSFNSVPIHFL